MFAYLNTSLMAIVATRVLYGDYARLYDTTRRLLTGDSTQPSGVLPLSSRLDADVLAVSQKMADTNVQIGMYETAADALSSIRQGLLGMRELADLAFSGDYQQKQLKKMDKEYQALADEVNGLLADTKYNGTAVLSGPDAVVSLDFSALDGIKLTDLPDDATTNLSMAIIDTVEAQGEVNVGLTQLRNTLANLADHSTDLLGFGDRITSYDLAMQAVSRLVADMQWLFETTLAAHANLYTSSVLYLLLSR